MPFIEISEITWNWSPATMQGNENSGYDTFGETFDRASIDDEDVICIQEHIGAGFLNYYEIQYKNYNILKVFNPNTVKHRVKP
jgi:hypothetical protein